MIDDRPHTASLPDELRIGDTIVRVTSVEGARVTLALSSQDGKGPSSAVEMRVASDASEMDSETRFDFYRSDEFRDQLVAHAHRAKEQAIDKIMKDS